MIRRPVGLKSRGCPSMSTCSRTRRRDRPHRPQRTASLTQARDGSRDIGKRIRQALIPSDLMTTGVDRVILPEQIRRAGRTSHLRCLWSRPEGSRGVSADDIDPRLPGAPGH